MSRNVHNKFEVKGQYYYLADIPCRRLLEIRDQSEVISDPDLFVIMMNPGSSEPKQASDCSDVPVDALHDATQEQIMRLMDTLNYRFARIINLSDMRAPKSKDLQNFLKTEQAKQIPHSIFDTSRKEELQSLLPITATYVVAWGVHYTLRPYARRALAALAGQTVYGWKKPSSADWEYYHPLPPNTDRQKKWLSTVVSQIKEGQAL